MHYKIHTIDLQYLGRKEAIAAFLVEANNALILVDTGPHSTIEILEKSIRQLGYQITDITHILLTHIHLDHAGAAWYLAEKSQSNVYVHPFGEKHLIDPTKLYNSAKKIYKEKMDMLWGDLKPIPKEQVIAVEDKTQVVCGTLTFQAHFTPGHARHHIAWQLEKDLFAGDVAGIITADGIAAPPCPPPDINPDDWLEAIKTIKNLSIDTLHLVHFGQVKNIEQHLFHLSRRLLLWVKYIGMLTAKGLSIEEVTPLLQNHIAEQLAGEGYSQAAIDMYEIQNSSKATAWGLMHYWKAKLSAVK